MEQKDLFLTLMTFLCKVKENDIPNIDVGRIQNAF